MAYTAPALSVAVSLTGGYTAPALSIQVVLGATATVVTGTLSADLPAATPALTFAATGERDRNWLNAALPAPSVALSLAATGEVIHAAALLASLPLTLPVLSLRARERSITVALAANLPAPTLPLTVSGAIEYLHALAVLAALPAPALSLTVSGAGDQDLALINDSGPHLRQDSAQSRVTATGRTLAQQPMLATRTAAGLNQTPADPIRVGRTWLHAHGVPIRRSVTERAAHGLPMQHPTGVPFAEALRQRRALAERAAQGLPIRIGAGIPATETIRTPSRRALTEQQAVPLPLRLPLGQHQARVTATGLTLRWTTAELPAPGYWWPFYRVPALAAPVVLSAPYTPRPLRCAVALGWTWITQPWCVGVDPAVPIQEVYVIVNTFSLLRADTAEALYALDFAASLEVDSWTWSWSAAIPATQESVVRSPTPGECVEVIATINGTALRLVVERLRRERRFGAATLSISGRGRAAWLAAPYSLRQTVANAESRTAQQLLNDALTVNGVPIGWAVDWRLTDWTVPAGAWSQTGTYMEAAQRIADAGGGYIQSHPTAPTLIVLPYYPTPPWQWAEQIPDLVLPEAVCVTEGIEWLDQPPYNAVWVVGGAAGRRDQITRAGTAGDCVAPTVVDPLATDTAMTRQRGLRVLADTGRQAHLNVSLPVFAEIGLITPGQLVQYTERGITRRGLSRAIRVECDFPQFRQTLQIETHELQSL